MKLLFTVVAGFLLCWTPFFLHCLLGCLGVHLPFIVGLVANVLMLSRGAVNPIIYCFRHFVFKAEFHSISRSCLSHSKFLKLVISCCRSKLCENGEDVGIQSPPVVIMKRGIETYCLDTRRKSKDFPIVLPPDEQSHDLCDNSTIESSISNQTTPKEGLHKGNGDSINTFGNSLLPFSNLRRREMIRSLSVPISAICPDASCEAESEDTHSLADTFGSNYNNVNIEYSRGMKRRSTTETIVSYFDLPQYSFPSGSDKKKTNVASRKKMLKISKSTSYEDHQVSHDHESVQRTVSVPLRSFSKYTEG